MLFIRLLSAGNQPVLVPPSPTRPLRISDIDECLALLELVAQHIPQVQALLAPNNGQSVPIATQSNQYAGQYTSQAAQAGPLNTSNPYTTPAANTNPFLGGIPATQQALAASSNTGMQSYAGYFSNSHSPTTYQPSHRRSTTSQQVADNLECIIPGCGKPVHVDAKGVKSSDYCSMRHRE